MCQDKMAFLFLLSGVCGSIVLERRNKIDTDINDPTTHQSNYNLLDNTYRIDGENEPTKTLSTFLWKLSRGGRGNGKSLRKFDQMEKKTLKRPSSGKVTNFQEKPKQISVPTSKVFFCQIKYFTSRTFHIRLPASDSRRQTD